MMGGTTCGPYARWRSGWCSDAQRPRLVRWTEIGWLLGRPVQEVIANLGRPARTTTSTEERRVVQFFYYPLEEGGTVRIRIVEGRVAGFAVVDD